VTVTAAALAGEVMAIVGNAPVSLDQESS
jgi:hypothetical protein